MASTRRKAAAIAIAVIGVAGLSLAAAAQLDITSANLAAGTTSVGACDTTGVSVDYTTSLVGTVYKATVINLTAVNAACTGKAYGIQLLQGTGTKTVLVDQLTGTLTVTGTGDAGTATISIPTTGLGQPDVAAITGISIVLH